MLSLYMAAIQGEGRHKITSANGLLVFQSITSGVVVKSLLEFYDNTIFTRFACVNS